MATALPTGTVSFLFTDIEGSARLWEDHAAAMASALARHDELLAQAIGTHRGVVFSTGGDGLAAVFARALDAVSAAVEAQAALLAERWPEPVVLRVRMGLHTGEAEERGGDYFGAAVNRAARVMTVADRGQVLVTAATAEVVRGLLPDGVALIDLGERELRSLARPERVFQVVWPGVHAPPPATGPAGPPGNLPRADRQLVGRDQEVAVVSVLLGRARLVTLTGVGGVGKTSLALEAARGLAGQFPDGAWFCELAAVADPAQVAQAVAETMGLRPQSGISQFELVVRALVGQACLVVLDNCEHVLDAAAALAEAVGCRCEGVRVLATSREALGVTGERLVAVRPLELADAVHLFETRVSEHAGFAAGAIDQDAVSTLCAQLDGLPLAIELAAARARSMSVTDLIDRLGERFRLLRGQRRAAERHQTLRATIAWSYDLLTQNEQRLFDRLSVFVGGFDLAAAEAVCAHVDLEVWEIDELVVSLADKSMVIAGAQGRYLLLETLRQFGEERLATTDAPNRFRDRHRQYFADFAMTVHDGLQGSDQVAWLARLHAEWANLRAAFNWAVATGNVDSAATIAVYTIWAATWHDTGEPLLWIENVARLPGAADHSLWSSVLAGRAWAAWDRGDLDDALDLGFEALDAEDSGAPSVDRLAHFAILSAAGFLGKQDLAEAHLDHVMAQADAAGQVILQAVYGTAYAVFKTNLGSLEEARVAARLAQRVAGRVGNPGAMAWALAQEGVALNAARDPDAEPVLERGLALAQDTGAVLAATVCERELAVLLARKGANAAAARLLAHALQVMRRKASWMFAGQTLFYAVVILARAGMAETAAVLYGRFRSSSAAGPFERGLPTIERRLVAALGTDRLEQLAAIGEEMPTERAVVLAETALTELLTD